MNKKVILAGISIIVFVLRAEAQTSESYIPNNLGRIVEVANSGGVLAEPYLLIGYDTTGFVKQSNSEGTYKIFGTTPSSTSLHELNIKNIFGAPSGHDCLEIRFGNDSSRYWINKVINGFGGNLAPNWLPFAVYNVGPRSSANPAVTGGTKLCIKITDKDSNGIYSPGEQIFVLSDHALPLDSTYDSLSHRPANPFPPNRSVLTNLRFGLASVPYDQWSFSVPWDGFTPAAGTVVRLVARTADSIPPVIYSPRSISAPNHGLYSYPVVYYSFETPLLELIQFPSSMHLQNDTIVWNNIFPFGTSYTYTLQAENSAGIYIVNSTAISGYRTGNECVNLKNNQINYWTSNNGSIAYNWPSGQYGMGWTDDPACLNYATGFYIAGKKHGQNSAQDTITVSNVEFGSEWGAGRILNQGPFDSLIAEDRTSESAKVFILPDHSNQWPDEAPHDSLGQPMRLSVRDTWTVFNDFWAKILTHDPNLLSPGFGIECQRQTFQFVDYPFKFSVLVRMRLMNKCNVSYDSCFFSLWADPDVGLNSGDDLCMVDSVLPCLITYSDPYGNDGSNSATGVYIIQKPLLAGISTDKTIIVTINERGFVQKYINNGIQANPASAVIVGPFGHTEEYDDFMRYNYAKGYDWRGLPKPNGRFDLLFGTIPFDKRILLSVGPFVMAAGDTQEVWYALMGAKGTTKANAVDSILNHAYLMKEIFYSDMNSVIVGVNDPENPVPQRVILHSNYPNPFNPSTTIRYELKQSSKVSLKIYNILGQEVRTLVNAQKSSGMHSVEWDGKNSHGQRVTSGVYFYRLEAGDFVKTRKMVLVK